MPVLLTPQGEWLQDTRDIIDLMEKRFPDSTVFPSTPCRKFVANILEAWADEFWIPMAMHYRWNRPESVAFFKNENGPLMVPWGPKFLQTTAVNKVAETLVSFLPTVGVRPVQYDALEEWTESMITHLDTHFALHPYLLGSSPTVGDFGLAGVFVPHLARDPWPRDHLMKGHPNLQAWVDRIQFPSHAGPHIVSSPTNTLDAISPEDGSDSIPPTLQPILHAISSEFYPLLQATILELDQCYRDPRFFSPSSHTPTTPTHQQVNSNRDLPRRLGECTISLLNKPFTRHTIPFHLWKVQKTLDAFDHDMTEGDRQRVREWLGTEQACRIGDVLDMKFPRLVRNNVKVKFE
jgi:glutathione S-transferase